MTDGSTDNYWLALRRLERSAVKVACCVLRGAGRSNAVRLLDYQVVEEHYPEFLSHLSESDKTLPQYVQTEFEEYLKCGRLEHGFLRVQCESCHKEQLVAFSCKRRGFCPSCGASRMVESAAMLVDSVLPHQPIRQWVLRA